jgi:hypothetical protein
MATEQITATLPIAQVRWLRSKAELHGTSVSSELKQVMHLAIGVEALVAVPGENIHYATIPHPDATA